MLDDCDYPNSFHFTAFTPFFIVNVPSEPAYKNYEDPLDGF